MTAMEMVLATLRGEPVGEAPENVVREALELAEAHHVLPTVLAAMPKAVGAAERSQARLQAFWWTQELKGVIAGFRAAGVAMMPLKGPAFAERAYGAAELRPCRDLDVLVRTEDLGRATAVLEGLGFAAADAGDDYHQTWMRGETAVELHRGVAIPGSFHFDVEGAWAKAERGTFAGEEILHFSAADELVYLCMHAARHRFERLSVVLDVHQALKRCGGRVAEELVSLATAQRLEGAVWVGCGLAARLRGETIGELPTVFAGVVDELWVRLTSGPPVEFTTPELYRFWLRLEPNGVARMRRRVDHLRIAMTRLIEDDYEFAERFGFGRSHKTLVRGLRVFRLLGRYAGR